MTRTPTLSSASAPYALPLGLGLLLLTAAPSAQAQEECGEITCDLGTTCEITQGACPEILCPENEPDCNSAADCDAEPFYSCVPTACESDDDCADYMACVTRSTWECPEEKIDCTGMTDAECDEAWADFEAQCQESERQECGIRWYEPCEEAADCGEGFECIPFEESCSCGGAAPAAEGEEVPVEEPECLCEPAVGGYCEPNDQACESDDDCLEHWTCEEVNFGGLCAVDREGNEMCDEPESEMKCMPPNLPSSGDFQQIASLGLDEAASSGVAGPEVQSLESEASDGALEEAVEEPGDDGASEEVRELPMGDADESAQSGEAPEALELEEEEAEVDAEDGSSDIEEEGSSMSSASDSGGGCSVSNRKGTDGGGLTALILGLGLAIGARRRRIRSRLWG